MKLHAAGSAWVALSNTLREDSPSTQVKLFLATCLAIPDMKKKFYTADVDALVTELQTHLIRCPSNEDLRKIHELGIFIRRFSFNLLSHALFFVHAAHMRNLLL
jgi:hypothetical protein